MSFNDLNETFNVDGEVVVPEVSPSNLKRLLLKLMTLKRIMNTLEVIYIL